MAMGVLDPPIFDVFYRGATAPAPGGPNVRNYKDNRQGLILSTISLALQPTMALCLSWSLKTLQGPDGLFHPLLHQ